MLLKRQMSKALSQSMVASFLLLFSYHQEIISIPTNYSHNTLYLLAFLAACIQWPNNPYSSVFSQITFLHSCQSIYPLQTAIIKSHALHKNPIKYRNNIIKTLKKGQKISSVIINDPTYPKKIKNRLSKSIDQGTFKQDIHQIQSICFTLYLQHEKYIYCSIIVLLYAYSIVVFLTVIFYGYLPYVQDITRMPL